MLTSLQAAARPPAQPAPPPHVHSQQHAEEARLRDELSAWKRKCHQNADEARDAERRLGDALAQLEAIRTKETRLQKYDLVLMQSQIDFSLV